MNSPEDATCLPATPLAQLDPEVHQAIRAETARQQNHLELIASENFTAPAILEATGSVLTNKYAEGYPSKRYYGGCEHIDTIETLAIERACELFKAEHANVQPHSGSQANYAVYAAALKPSDTLLTLQLNDGGHLTHGSPANFSGKLYKPLHYQLDPETNRIDYDALQTQAIKARPKLITVGASAYPRHIDFERIAHIAQKADALVLADIAHIAGLVAAGLHPSPIPHADFVTTTTHKSLRGPRGGLILCKAKHKKAINSALFPGTQSGPLMHSIAAKAICFHLAAQADFKTYSRQIINNAQALAEAFLKLGYKLSTGGTDNHLILIDLRANFPELTGLQAQEALENANITTNRNTVPNESRSPFQTSGIRLGTPALSTRGMKEPEMAKIAKNIHSILQDPENPANQRKIRQKNIELCSNFPLPYA